MSPLVAAVLVAVLSSPLVAAAVQRDNPNDKLRAALGVLVALAVTVLQQVTTDMTLEGFVETAMWTIGAQFGGYGAIWRHLEINDKVLPSVGIVGKPDDELGPSFLAAEAGPAGEEHDFGEWLAAMQAAGGDE